MSVTSRESHLVRFSRGAAALVALAGGVVLFGWGLDIDALKRVVPGLVTMKANTAASLLFAGAALFLLNERSSNLLRRRIGRTLAAIVVAVAGLTIIEYVAQANFGIDEILFRDAAQATATSHPGRMSPLTAIGLALCGLALLLLDRHPRAAHSIAIVVLVLATFGVSGYVFGAQSLYRFATYTAMAVHTAAALWALSLGIIAARTKQGFVAVIVGDSAGGIMARRLLWTVPLLLFGLGWLALQGQREGFYDDRYRLALVIVTGMVLSFALILRVARLLQELDGRRQQFQEQLAALNASLEQTVEDRTHELAQANQQLATEIGERKEAEEEVRRLSLTDELTGLLNRRGFLLLAEQALKTARVSQAVYALIFLDLDGLKRVNDAHGHRAGDVMIGNAAKILKATFRDVDLIGRLGGDEFAVLVANGERTEIMLSRIRGAAAQLSKDDSLQIPLSFSAGVLHCVPAEEKPLLELLADADALMYEQKKQHQLKR